MSVSFWCGASKSEAEAYEIVKKMAQKGLAGEVFLTTDWSNLNKERWYVITAGVYVSKEDANANLKSVQTVYKDAYVKYSGEFQRY